jgi:hypothetical protein
MANSASFNADANPIRFGLGDFSVNKLKWSAGTCYLDGLHAPLYDREKSRSACITKIGNCVSCHHIFNASTGFADAALVAGRQQPRTAAAVITAMAMP